MGPAEPLAPGLAAPASLSALFMAFTRLALQGFGGVLPVAQRELVERLRWVTREQFLEMLSVGQVLPGPNVINLALMIGDRFYGVRGAVVAVAGITAAPTMVVLLLAALAAHWRNEPMVVGALRGMGIAAAGLVLATAIRLGMGLRHNPLGPALCALFVVLTAVAIGGLRWPLVWVVLAVGAASVVLAWRRISP
ncbi:MAG: chromate transporter [Pseudomonadota bacterium]|nr:chromate transporter [Pseudomonadota bacterium]